MDSKGLTELQQKNRERLTEILRKKGLTIGTKREIIEDGLTGKQKQKLRRKK